MSTQAAGKHVAVIGAGISGLVTAFWLSRRGFDVTVIEKQPRVGGTIETLSRDGFLVETGPNSALETTPLIKTLANQLDIADRMIYASDAAKNRYIVRNGRLHPVPLSPGGFLGSRLFSLRAKLRLLKEPFIPRGDDPEETIAAFVERRMGGEFLEYAINPFVAGVYAGDPRRLSVAAAFPRLYDLERRYGSVLRGAVSGRSERKRREGRGEVAKQSARLFSFRAGLSTLTEAIGRRLGASVMLGCAAQGVEPTGRAWRVSCSTGDGPQSILADAVVIATPARTAASLIAPLDRQLADALEAIYYPPVAMVFLGYRADAVVRKLDGFGFLIPENERRSILGTIWSSTLFAGRAPAGHVCFTTFIGGSRQPALAGQPEASLLEITRNELAALLGIEDAPVYHNTRVWSHAIPQYTTGYNAFLDQLMKFEERSPGLHFCANFRGGIAVADCIKSADRTVSALSEYFSR